MTLFGTCSRNGMAGATRERMTLAQQAAGERGAGARAPPAPREGGCRVRTIRVTEVTQYSHNF